MLHSLAPAAFACLALAQPALAQSFTVGVGGDFPNFASAMASPLVVAGVTLEALPGDHGFFTIDKPVHVRSKGASAVRIQVDGVPSFSLQGFQVGNLQISNVTGHGVVAECQVGLSGVTGPYESALSVLGSQNIVLSRVSSRGISACYPDGADVAATALAISASTVTVVDGTFTGGKVVDDSDPLLECEAHYPAVGAGVFVTNGSVVDVIASSMTGQVSTWPDFSRAGLEVVGSVVDVRGHSGDVVEGANGLSIEADGASVVHQSGVTLQPAQVSPNVLPASTPGKFVLVDGVFGLGQVVTTKVHAPVGTATWTTFGAPSAPAPLWGGDLWLDPLALGPLVALPASGIETPASFTSGVPINFGLLGARLVVQTLAFDASGFEILNPYFVTID